METFQFYFELIGAAAFAISGAALGIRKEMDLFGVAMLGMTTAVGGANWFLVLFMGMLTGVGGGVLRDVCSAERPYIFTKHVYACASLAGAAVCLLLWPLGAGAAMMTGCGVTLALRICAAAFRWSLPKA